MQRLNDAMPELAQAVQSAPGNARYAYVYAIALHTAGQSSEGLGVLRTAHEARPADVDILIALTTISRDTGDLAAAKDYAAQLLRAAPNNPDAQALSQSLEPAP